MDETFEKYITVVNIENICSKDNFDFLEYMFHFY